MKKTLGRIWAVLGPVAGILAIAYAGAIKAGEISGTGRLADYPNLDIRQVQSLIIKNVGAIPADEVKNFVIKSPQDAYEIRNLTRIELWNGQVKPAQEIEKITVRLSNP
ncbi:MAG TPA: hypothetical protein VL588_02460 [Bdellovibrionota bacterium]|nr:hypothetical protein [Bdellovibrionota bacterium]